MIDCRDAETLIQIRGDNVCWIRPYGDIRI